MRALAQKLEGAAEQISYILNRLDGYYSQYTSNWSGSSKRAFDEEFQRIRGDIAGLKSTAIDLASRLYTGASTMGESGSEEQSS